MLHADQDHIHVSQGGLKSNPYHTFRGVTRDGLKAILIRFTDTMMASGSFAGVPLSSGKMQVHDRKRDVD